MPDPEPGTALVPVDGPVPVAGLEPTPVPGVIIGVGEGSPMSLGVRFSHPVNTHRDAARARIRGVFIIIRARSFKVHI